MLQPVRMALSEISVRLQKTGADLMVDPVFGQKLGTVTQQYAAPITLLGQPRFLRADEQSAGEAGDVVPTDGYVTVSAREIRDKGLTPNQLKNARIVGMRRLHNAVGTVDTTEYLINEVRPRGHLAGGPVIFKLYFEKFKDLHGGSRS